MKLSLNWLKEYVVIRLTAQQVAERLTMAGLEVTDRRVVEDDVLFECEVTPNRPDWLSHVGVARELAALTGARWQGPRATLPKPVPGARPTITIQDRKACRRYVGILLEGVTVGPSPSGLRAKVEAMGLRSINNVVDVTNVVLFELGQPLHAFDADQLARNRIVVRRAKPGETLKTIDGVERRLDPTILVIADGERPVAVAGIMGGQATEVTAATRRVFLESAWFDPLVIRRASRTLGLSSESSYRFERGVDLEQVAAAARRVAALIVEVAGGHVVGGPVDRGTGRVTRRSLPWHPAHAQTLGTSISATTQRRLFERLGCHVSGSGARPTVRWHVAAVKGGRTTALWHVTPPSFRGDLNASVDLLEELARLWGYGRLPVTLPPPVPPASALASAPDVDWRGRERNLRDLLVASGLDEILTYSLVNPDDLARIMWGRGEPIALRNPLSRDRSVLRPTLLIGALETVARNLNRRAPGVAVFELGRIYHWPPNGQPQERRALSMALAGLRPSSWDAKPRPWTLYDAKGIIEAVAQQWGAITWQPREQYPWFRPGTGLEPAGSPPAHPMIPESGLGVIKGAIAANFEIPPTVEVVVAELMWEALWPGPAPLVSVHPLPKVPPVRRDLAILVEEAVTHEQIVAVIRSAGAPLAQSVILFDAYRGPQVPAGQKGLAYTVVYSAGDRTLIDAEVTTAHTVICRALQTQLGATLRQQRLS